MDMYAAMCTDMCRGGRDARALQDMCMDMCVDMRMDMCVDMRMDMLTDMCVDMHIDMCVGMCTEMRTDMCVDMHVNMCVDVRVDVRMYGHAYRHAPWLKRRSFVSRARRRRLGRCVRKIRRCRHGCE